jgi:hypothetical protein
MNLAAAVNVTSYAAATVTGDKPHAADSVVALFRATDVTDNGNGTSTLRTVNFGTAQNLCASERFREQPAGTATTGCFCSGFLVARDIIATAGHCMISNVTNIRFIFGFRMRDATTAETVISNNEIYSGVSVIGSQNVQPRGADWALVRINRRVTNHRVANIRRSGKVPDNQAVHVIGHPVGLPTKFAGGAAVRDNQPAAYFVANLDTYGGNSGSPVFNRNSHEVEGILVRGETDFVQQGNCFVSLVCPTTGCRGEDCTRTTVFENLVPWASPLKKGLDDPVQFKKPRDDPPVVKKAIDDPVHFKKFRDDDVAKRVRDELQGKRFRDPILPFAGGGLRPFSLSTTHHAKLAGAGGEPEAASLTNLMALEQEWFDVQAALTQARATSAQAEADAARLEQLSNALATTLAELDQQSAAHGGQGDTGEGSNG